MADHGYYEELITAELDGELTPDQEAELRAHLCECERCRAFREAVAAVEGLSTRHLPEPPAELTANVMAAVRAQAKDKKKKGKILAFPGRSLAVAAAAALVLWVGFRAADVFRPKGMVSASMAATAEDSGGTYDGTEAEEPAQVWTYGSEESQDSAEDPSKEPGEVVGPKNGISAPAVGAGGKGASGEDVLCQIRTADGLIRTLPVSRLPEGLLISDKTCDDPDREPDYILRIPVPEGDPEEYRFWEQDGVMIVETDAGEFGYTVSAEVFLKLFME